MERKSLVFLDYFKSFHQKDVFYEQVIDEKNAIRNIFNHFLILVLFSFLYGIVMGCYNGLLQAFSSGIKLPLIFTLIIIICFPVFFVIQSILGSKLTLPQMPAIISSGFVLTTFIMVSFAPIVLFFFITGDNYSFMKLLHVGIFIVSGIFGMKTIIEALKFSCEKKSVYPKIGVQVFKFWIIILAFVGAQLSWSLRPFIGDRNLPFVFFRQQEGNFYKAVLESVQDILIGKVEKNIPRRDVQGNKKREPSSPLLEEQEKN